MDNCLAVDPTGVACCSHGADCGAAGTVEMPDWDVSLVTSMSELFKNKASFNADISRWDVSSATSMYAMFWGASNFNADISRWDVSSVVTSMQNMFYTASQFNADISRWDVSSVTTMASMFEGAKAFNQLLSRWDVSSVTTMAYMFYDADAFNTMPVGWDTSKVTASGSMFTSADTWTARFTGGGTSTLPGSEWTRIEDACDASYPPLNGDVGNCTDTLMSGTSCVPDVRRRVRTEGREPVVHRPCADGGCRVCPPVYRSRRAQGHRGRVPWMRCRLGRCAAPRTGGAGIPTRR